MYKSIYTYYFNNNIDRIYTRKSHLDQQHFLNHNNGTLTTMFNTHVFPDLKPRNVGFESSHLAVRTYVMPNRNKGTQTTC